ncbi:hypothetical protein LJC46_02250 [Desulfovibrio sp. OttesenSCG-928-G15]|nr:hypothetical protein [Desulfovibrio sp. OttesenSCG-928-G15]
MATQAAIAQALGTLATIYRHPLSNAELAVLARAWFEDFEAFDDAIFDEACKQYRRKSRYFPTVADLYGLCEDCAARERENRRALPDAECMGELTPEDHARLKAQAEKLAKACRAWGKREKR